MQDKKDFKPTRACPTDPKIEHKKYEIFYNVKKLKI